MELRESVRVIVRYFVTIYQTVAEIWRFCTLSCI